MHLYTWHRQLHDEPFKEFLETTQASTQLTQGTMDDFVCYTNTATLPHTSERARKLTHTISEMIARDIHPISIVDDAGFLDLLKVAEP